MNIAPSNEMPSDGTRNPPTVETSPDPIAHALGTHKKVALQISGGKDSLACLYLLKPYWDRITVVWWNGGAMFPEVIEQMQQIRAMVPHFLEIKSDQPSQIARMGFPTDVVPIRNTKIGKSLQPNEDLLLQSFLGCCWENFWFPMQQEMIKLGVTLVIRGQRAAEARRAPISNGHVEGGIAVWFPIEHWSDQQVVDYLKSQDVEIPKYYEYTQKSLDCHTCTAYLDESLGRMRYTKEKHPELWPELENRLRLIRDAQQAEMRHVEAALMLENGALLSEAEALNETVEAAP